MNWLMDRWEAPTRFVAQMVVVASVGLLAGGLAAPVAVAQQQQPATPKAKATQQPKGQAKPAPAAPAAQGNQSKAAWFKLCTKNEQTGNKEICLTQYEQTDSSTGIPVFGAAIRKIVGEDKIQFLVLLNQAALLALPPGVEVRIDEQDPIKLTYAFCFGQRCQAEAPLTPELLESLRKGKQMMIAAINVQRKVLQFPVPLAGFSKAYDGAPVDNAKYEQMRRKQMETIRKRQMELANKAAEAQRKKQQQGGAQAPAQGAPNATAQPKKPATPAPQ